jgi:hypothetical protein
LIVITYPWLMRDWEISTYPNSRTPGIFLEPGCHFCPNPLIQEKIAPIWIAPWPVDQGQVVLYTQSNPSIYVSTTFCPGFNRVMPNWLTELHVYIALNKLVSWKFCVLDRLKFCFWSEFQDQYSLTIIFFFKLNVGYFGEIVTSDGNARPNIFRKYYWCVYN